MKGFKMSFDKNILRKIEFKHSNTWLYANELFNAIDDFYKTEDEYKYFAEVEGRERGIVFRIAHILANRLERKYNVYVDCEANRCNGEVYFRYWKRIFPLAETYISAAIY